MVTRHSSTLRGKIRVASFADQGAGTAFLNHPRLGDIYGEYMIRLHWVIRASVPLMEAALARARQLEGDDPVAAGLASYLAQHIREERLHDEWLLDDLEVIDLPRDKVLARIPSPSVAAVVGAQYYWIQHHH